MPIHVEWADDQKTILYCHFNGMWTLAELQAMFVDYLQMVDSVPHTVDTMIDLQHSLSMPRNITSIRHTVATSERPNYGATIIIGRSNLINQVVAQVLHFLPFRIPFDMATDRTHAYAILAEHRELRQS